MILKEDIFFRKMFIVTEYAALNELADGILSQLAAAELKFLSSVL